MIRAPAGRGVWLALGQRPGTGQGLPQGGGQAQRCDAGFIVAAFLCSVKCWHVEHPLGQGKNPAYQLGWRQCAVSCSLLLLLRERPVCWCLLVDVWAGNMLPGWGEDCQVPGMPQLGAAP